MEIIKKNIISILLFIYLICIFNISNVNSENVLGEVEVSDTLTIDTSSLNSQISYKYDETINKAKIIVTLVSGEVEELNDIIKISDDKKSITFGDFSQISSGNQLNGFNIKSLIVMVIGILSLGLISKTNFKSSNLSYLMFSIVFIGIFIGASNSDYSISQVSIKVDIAVPVSFRFNSLVLNLGVGSSNIAGLMSNNFKIDACSSTTAIDSHEISLNQLIISGSLEVCSNSNITINGLQLSTKTQIVLDTISNINLNFYNGFTGKVDITSSSLKIDDGCSLNVNGTNTKGSCNNGTTSELIIKNSVSSNITNVISLCLLDPTWRPVPADSSSPVSPSIMTTQPAVDFGYGKSDFVFMGQYGFSANQSILDGPNGVSNSFTLNFTIWGPYSNWIVAKPTTPILKSNSNYQLSFGFKLGQALNDYNRVSNITLAFYSPGDITDPNSIYQYFEAYKNPAPIYSKTFTTGDFSSNTEFKQNAYSFTPNVDISRSVMALQINKTTLNGPNGFTMIIKDFKLTIPSKSITTPNLLTKDSELVTLPRPSSDLDPQDPSTCPYLAQDLVHWHDPSIWGGSVPSPSSVITLPAGKRVLISPCSISQTQVYKKIVIPVGSELVFADSDLTMNVQDIYVQGNFTMGTSTCRYNANINIVFNGAKTTSDTIAQYFGSKGIAVAAGGFISVQGKQYHNSWTKLASTAWSGDYVVYVQDSVNWEVGQKVLITTSYYRDEEENQNEVLTIAAIKDKVIQFTEPLRFYHYGGQEYQAEIGLLSRRIVFRSDDSKTSQFGGHVLVNGEGQFSGLQLIRMGQTNIKARYPLHYHLAGNVTRSYIKDCSVTDSYYRCYTIHGTNNVILERNVAFNATGHCYYLEDGVEQFNSIRFNLASYVHPIGDPAGGAEQTGEVFIQNDGLTQPADSAAGCFYITNAWNDFVGNAASGGWSGYAFPNLDKPIGNFRTLPMVPKYWPIKTFEGNTAHSSGYFWSSAGSIYVGGNLTYNEADGLLYYNSGRFSRGTYKDGIAKSGNEVWMRYNNTKIYLSNRGVSHWGERVEVVGFESHDSNRPGTLFGDAWLGNAIVNGQSNSLNSRLTASTRQGFQWYDTYVQTILSNVIFRNYVHNPRADNPENDNRVLISMTHSDVYKPQGISATINIKTENVASSQIIGHRITDTGSSRDFNFIDWDGSMTGKNVPTLVGSHVKWWQFDSTCQYNNDWSVYVCTKGDKEIANLQFWIPNLIDRDTQWPATSYVGNISLFGNGITDRRSTIVTQNAGVTGVSNMGWYLYLTTGSPSEWKIWVAQVIYKNYVFLAVPYPANTQFTIYFNNTYTTKYNTNYNMANSAAEVRSGDGKTFYFDGSFLYLKIVNHALTGASTEYFERGGARIYNVIWENTITIKTSNTKTPPVNGYYTNIADNLPSGNL